MSPANIFKFARLIILLGLYLCSSLSARAQSEQNAQFTQGSSGTNTMTFQVPLGSLPGRGVTLPISLNYNSKVWRLGFLKTRYWTPNGKNSVAEAIYSEFATAGWTTSLNVPVVEWPKSQDLYWYTGKPYANGTVSPCTYRVARVFIHMPDGSTHELRKADAVQPDTGSVDMYGTFYAVDGSRMRYDANGATDGVLFLSDGTRYVISSTTIQYIDTDGNAVTYDVASRQWTDTMNRTIGMPWPAVPQAGTNYQYSVPGLNGGTVTYTFKFAQLSAALSPNSPALKPVGDWYLPNPSQPPGDYNIANNPQPQSPSMFQSRYTDPDELDYRTYTQVIGRSQAGTTNFNPVVLAEVVLPNGLSYKFTYNNYGELDKIIYPSGAYQRYEYGSVPALGYPAVPYDQASRGLKNRWLSASGSGTDELQWTYSFESPFSIVLTAPGPSGAPDGIRTKTYLHNEPNLQNNFGYDDALNGLPYEERIYAPAVEGGALLRRTLTKWQHSSGTYNRPSPGTGTYTASRNPRATKTVALWLDTGGDALSSTSTFGYDTTYWWNVGLDRTSSSEYGFVLVPQNIAQNDPADAIPQGTLVRTTNTTYLTNDSNYRNRNILGLPTYTSISDANGLVSQTSINYDESSYPLISFGPVVGWNDPQTAYRGNATTLSKWLNYPAPTWIQTHMQYDQCGNMRKSWDGMGRMNPSVEIDYSASYYNAYPTSTSTIAPDPTGSYAQPTALVSSSVFDLNTGLVTSSTDPNGRTTSFEYNDPFYRQTMVMRPDGGWTSTVYNDDPSDTYVRTQTLQHTTPTQQVIESYQYFDKLGRSVRTFANEGSAYLTADTQYDLLGRVWRVSNPYRTTAPSLETGVNPSNQWTTNNYDSQNRVTSVTTTDGAHSNSSYGYSLGNGYLGISVTASDQMGRSRKSITDSLGRVIQVIEAPSGAAHQTNYTYDVFNNLRKVEQGSQSRYFAYDSLSRVIFVRQIEQTINTSLPAWTDPVTNYSGGWTAAFTYDNNGNVATQRDARNITTTFTYDQLNRVTTVRYTNDLQNTAGVDNYYDGYRSNSYTNIPNVKGHAWQKETSNQVRFTVDNFDVMGRPTIQRQQFWLNNEWKSSYQVSESYDLSGGLVGRTYPSGHSVTYESDRVGRLQQFSGNLGAGGLRTYANNFQYSDSGALQQEQFGTDTPLYHKQHFNARGQLWDMRLSTVSFTSDPANGDRGSIVNFYSSNYEQGGSGTDNNGNLLRQEIYVPNGPYFQQTYSYDDLNRLTSVNEKLNGAGSDSFKQVYTYDRWGNRSIDGNLSSTNVPRPTYMIDSNTNRLIAPSGFSFGYDNAGNQTNDTYTGGGQRVFDAENHMISAQESSGWQQYKYSGSGLRVRRIVNGAEVWQVYGLGRELLAEYAADASPASPSKEYGYRNGQLLVTAAAGGGTTENVVWTNIVGATASGNSLTKTAPTAWGNAGASSTRSIVSGDGYVEFKVTAPNTGMVGLSHTDANQDYSSMEYALLPNSDGNLYVFESGLNRGVVSTFTTADVFRVAIEGGVVKYRKNGALLYTSTLAPTYPLLVDAGLYINGSSHTNVVISGNLGGSTTENVVWTNVVGATASGNSLTKTAPTVWGNAGASSTRSIVSGDGYVEFKVTAPNTGMVGLSHTDANQDYSSMEFALLPNSDGNLYVFESGLNRGVVSTFTTADVFRVAIEGGVVKYRKNGALVYTSSLAPTYPLLVDAGLYVSGSSHTNVVISGNLGGGGGGMELNWLVSDQLGTPRIIVDSSGSLASVKRHDYLPFGEEIGGSQVGLIGGRQGTPGYMADNVRQKFTGYEADTETGLYYAQARYQSSVQGRFTGVDPVGASANIGDPQSFNRYSYVQNTPLTAVDPTGMALWDIGVYQTSNPEVVDKINQKIAIKINPPLPPPRAPIKFDPNQIPPPPGGPVSPGPPKIDIGPPPLPIGEQPWPTSVDVVEGPNLIYWGMPVISPSGIMVDPKMNYGSGRVIEYIIRNQVGEPMGPETGVVVSEEVKAVSAEARSLERLGLLGSNPNLSTTDSNGILPDKVGLFSRDRRSLKVIFENPLIDVVLRQDITISMQTPDGRISGALFMRNVIEAKSLGATLTRGNLRHFPRP